MREEAVIIGGGILAYALIGIAAWVFLGDML